MATRSNRVRDSGGGEHTAQQKAFSGRMPQRLPAAPDLRGREHGLVLLVEAVDFAVDGLPQLLLLVEMLRPLLLVALGHDAAGIQPQLHQ